MTDPVNAEDDLVETVAKIIDPNAFAWAEQDSQTEARICRAFERARAALEAVRSTRDGEIERLREALSDLADAVYRDGEGEFGIGGLSTMALLRAHQALNQGTDNVG